MWPKDTTAGRVVLVVVVAPLLLAGVVGIKAAEFPGPLWAWLCLGGALLVTGIFKLPWNRGYFGPAAGAPSNEEG